MIEWLCVCCAQCGKFQGQQRKKVSKWQCKVCGHKQSLVKVFAVSFEAKDIRKVVQDLNMTAGEAASVAPLPLSSSSTTCVPTDESVIQPDDAPKTTTTQQDRNQDTKPATVGTKSLRRKPAKDRYC